MYCVTKFVHLSGEPGRGIVLARRQGSTWFIGALTAEEGRLQKVLLSFLSQIGQSIGPGFLHGRGSRRLSRQNTLNAMSESTWHAAIFSSDIVKQDGIDFNITYNRTVGFGTLFASVTGTCKSIPTGGNHGC